MSLIEFPVAQGDSYSFPSEPLCPICGERPVFEPHEFVGLSGGSATENLKGEGFLSVFLHPRDDSSESGAEVEIVRDTSIGQFDFYFCSTRCLRSFLNECVDELERRIARPSA